MHFSERLWLPEYSPSLVHFPPAAMWLFSSLKWQSEGMLFLDVFVTNPPVTQRLWGELSSMTWSILCYKCEHILQWHITWLTAAFILSWATSGAGICACVPLPCCSYPRGQWSGQRVNRQWVVEYKRPLSIHNERRMSKLLLKNRTLRALF